MENEFISRIDLASSLIDAKETKGHGLTHAEVIQFIRKFPAAKVVTLEHHKKIKGILEREVETLVDILDKEKLRGEWIVTAEDNDGVHRICCPFCSYEKGSNNTDPIIVTFSNFPKFCENCGAELKGGVSDEIDN